MTAQSRLLLVTGVLAILVAACAGATSPSPAGTPNPSPIVVDAPSASPVPSSQPQAEPSAPVTPADPSAKPEPTPTPAPLVWSKARTVKGLQGCSDVVATVDDGGTSHIAATCGSAGGQVKYAASEDGLAWMVTSFKVPSGRFEQDPEIAFSGSTLYLAYTRVAPADAGCGDDGLDDVGVYVRSRSLPNGDWSDASKIGATSDHLRAFRVSGSVIHATVTNDKSQGTFYERVSGGAASRVRIGEQAGRPSASVMTARPASRSMARRASGSARSTAASSQPRRSRARPAAPARQWSSGRTTSPTSCGAAVPR
jgi:hypothetical protein